jgi:hemolysin D
MAGNESDLADPGSQREFLPAALALQQTPASPLGRRFLWLLLVLLLLGLLWSIFGKVDIVVSAPGRIVPSGRVKVVQAPESGALAAIYVTDGERVEAGQALFALDQTFADADALGIARKLEDHALQMSWRRSYEEWLEAGPEQEVVFAPASLHSQAGSRVSEARNLYTRHKLEVTAALQTLERQLAANEAERASLLAEQAKIRATLGVQLQRVGVFESLMERKFGARLQYLQLLQEQAELEKTLPVLEAKVRQLEQGAAGIQARMSATLNGKRKDNLLELARLGAEYAALQQEQRKARQRREKQVLLAPVAGTVHELAVHTVGAIVSPAQELLKIVPESAGLEVEALLRNRDIGFLREGQQAEVKVEAFNFTKYGLLDAKIVDIGNDAVQDKNMAWVFKVKLALVNEQLEVDGRMVGLSPGMAVTAEVVTGRRRLVEYFLSPLLRYTSESVRER